VTVQSPPPSADKPRPLPDLPADLPEPADKATVPAAGGYSLVATGIGGTGVVMLNQVLATAAFLDGLGVTGLDQTGLSQKAGPVVSHLRLWRGDQDPADGPRNAHVAHPAASNAVGEESADLLLALDVLVAAEPRHLSRLRPDRTVTVASTSLVPTAGMVRGATGAPDLVPLIAALRELTKPGSFTEVDTVALATALFGDAIAANLIALGAAYQAGAVPLEAASIARAIELNGVAVDRNQAAFLAGRLAVHDPGRLPSARRAGELRREPAAGALKAAAAQAADRGITGPAADLAARRAAELVSYQNPALASRYLDLVAAAARAEADLPGGAGGPGELPLAVADGFFHLLAYKDEYEVARLHLLPEFRAALAEAVPGGHGIRYQLHPPVLRALGMRRKLALPAPVARPAFGVLRAMRHVRGTPADVFGYSRVRRTERRLAAEYEDGLRAVLPGLDEGRLAAMVALARLPLGIRGYEHIKLAAITRYAADRAKLLCELGGGELGGPAEGPA
jgi:indolepyruvate ferredoxin oxidoreductase